MTSNPQEVVKYSFPIRYKGNIFFPILFLIIWFPIGILLMFRNCYFIDKQDRFHLKYHGSWAWLYFWGFFFFPIAILLLVFKGVDVMQERHIF